MPSKSKCSKIKDPAARKRCMEYKGEFADNTDDNKATLKSRRGSKKVKY